MQQNQLLTIGGLLISVGAISYLLFSDIETEPSQEEIATVEQSYTVVKKQSDVAIDYTKNEVQKVQQTFPSTKQTPRKKTPEPKKEKDPFLESKTLDKTHTFELSIINHDRDTSRHNGRYLPVHGKIDKNEFTLRIPQYLVQDGVGSTILRIKNLKSGDVQTVPAVFIDDMKNNGEYPKLTIDSSDLQNYQQEIIKQITPPLPGRNLP
jgi:hypothetical protein